MNLGVQPSFLEDLTLATFDCEPYRSSAVGFDRLFDYLQGGSPPSTADNFPQVDVEQDGEDSYRITLALPGFREDEIEIVSKQNQLVVSGRKAEKKEPNYIHRGITARSFERTFVLGDYIRVKGANLQDGLLAVELAREIPEEMKPRKIDIGGAR